MQVTAVDHDPLGVLAINGRRRSSAPPVKPTRATRASQAGDPPARGWHTRGSRPSSSSHCVIDGDEDRCARCQQAEHAGVRRQRPLVGRLPTARSGESDFEGVALRAGRLPGEHVGQGAEGQTLLRARGTLSDGEPSDPGVADRRLPDVVLPMPASPSSTARHPARARSTKRSTAASSVAGRHVRHGKPRL
jgi:hypothetical protein